MFFNIFLFCLKGYSKTLSLQNQIWFCKTYSLLHQNIQKRTGNDRFEKNMVYSLFKAYLTFDAIIAFC